MLCADCRAVTATVAVTPMAEEVAVAMEAVAGGTAEVGVANSS